MPRLPHCDALYPVHANIWSLCWGTISYNEAGNQIIRQMYSMCQVRLIFQVSKSVCGHLVIYFTIGYRKPLLAERKCESPKKI